MRGKKQVFQHHQRRQSKHTPGRGGLAVAGSAISHFAVKLKIKAVTDIYLNMELKMQQKKEEVVLNNTFYS